MPQLADSWTDRCSIVIGCASLPTILYWWLQLKIHDLVIRPPYQVPAIGGYSFSPLDNCPVRYLEEYLYMSVVYIHLFICVCSYECIMRPDRIDESRQ